MYRIEQRNKFSVGEQIEIMKPDGRNLTVTVQGIYDETGASVESAPHPQQKLAVDLGAEVENMIFSEGRRHKALSWNKRYSGAL